MNPHGKGQIKMQNVSFNDVSELIDFTGGATSYRIKASQDYTEHVAPATERLSYNVPFYRIKTDICFIWPEAVLWG